MDSSVVGVSFLCVSFFRSFFFFFLFFKQGILTGNLQHWVRIIYCVVVNILFDFLRCPHVRPTLVKIPMISHAKILPVSATLFYVMSFLRLCLKTY